METQKHTQRFGRRATARYGETVAMPRKGKTVVGQAAESRCASVGPRSTSLRATDVPHVRSPMGRPPKINRERIVVAALEIGLADLTLGAVAERLGVTQQALYHHVRDREQLLDIVTEQLTERVPIPPDDGSDWCEWAYGFAHALKRLYEAAPGLADRAVEKTQLTPGVLTRFETSMLIALRSGFDDVTALWATRAITEFASSWVSREQRRNAIALRTGISYADGLVAGVEAQSDVKTPLLLRALRKSYGQSLDVRFEYTLRSLLVGIDMQRRSGFCFGVGKPGAAPSQ
ncbi:TetR/AcrR family transcriptional regulator [Paraburkholderia fungorum]|uniref:TetR/AcrR family transcriptional regulator n=1 Tax=Paraburkholderia fungorum TaxID=134537 RepID=UPI00402B1821